QQQRDFPAFPIADPSDHDAAERPNHETDAEHREGREQLRDLVAGWKEVLADDAGQIGVDREIVPFEHVADDGRPDRLADLDFLWFVHGFPPLHGRPRPFPEAAYRRERAAAKRS